MGTKRSDEPRNRPAGRQGDRGQTTLDFAIGVSVFLAVLLFIFLFVPGILSPFTASAQDETVTSNRVADQLAAGTLASPEQPYVLDRYCTVSFFQNNTADCRFPEGPLETQVGLDTGYQRVNVSLRGNLSSGGGGEVVCWDGTGPDRGLVAPSDSACDTVLERGDPVPTSRPSVTSVRVVSLDGQDVTLFVEMW
ncbi:DUF7287 family protein [Haloarcula onubensis]|uniref:Flagellin n=1 Tax=Haloarcula onubensis TaxID=2950539 RepID=A0ABU2FS53_9EURY|nr:hypothetical protein [Halomicroarcula sp. S3CR25-11]MDS0282981.1 hypothetical protein [Halomicroarcula sp. S3CR25-11]